MPQDQQDRALIVDEFGELQRQIDLFAPTIARAKILRQTIENWYASAPSDRSATCDGFLYRVFLGPKSRERIVNCEKLYGLLGSAFWDHAEFPLKILDTLVIDRTDLISEERTGRRTVQSVLREAVTGPDENEEVVMPQEPPKKRGRGRPAKKRSAAGRAHARGEARA